MSAPEPPESLAARYRAHVGPVADDRRALSLASALGGLGALAAATALAVLGAELVGSGRSEVTGAGLGGAFGAGGAVLLVAGREPLRSAGLVAVATGVPMAFAFALLGDGSYSSTEPAVVVALSTVVWAVLHFSGPARGSPLLLALALGGVWFTIVVKVGLEVLYLGAPLAEPPDSSTAVAVSLLFGTAYVAGADALDRRGLLGTATVFLGVGMVVLAFAVVAGTQHAPGWAAGAFVLSVGALVAFVGFRAGRRLSTWVGALAMVAGALTLVGDAVSEEDEVATAVVAFFAAVAVVAVTPWVARLLGEGDIPDA